MLLERLSNACGVSGGEHEVIAVLQEELQGHVDEMWTDVMGNLIIRKGAGPVTVMVDAHTDEIGFCVAAITGEGYLRLKKVGGIDDRVIPGRAVWVTNRRIPGVIGLKAFHLTDGDERNRAPAFDRLYVDLGCKSDAEVAALGIELGDPVYFASRFERFSEKVVKGKAFDDRAGCAVLATLLQRFSYPNVTLYGAFTAQEEVGLRGAKTAAYYLHPDVGIALEGTGAAVGFGAEARETGTDMGEGPVISLMDAASIPHVRVFEQLVALAQRESIRCQYRRHIAGGTDAGAIFVQRTGVPTCTISVPCRYIHTAAAMLHLDDFEGAVSLLHHFIQSVEKGEFHP